MNIDLQVEATSLLWVVSYEIRNFYLAHCTEHYFSL